MTEEELDRIKRAEEIQRYTENRCEALEKENEELRLKWLQATDEGTSWANLKSRENEIEELRQQIEKMKCCGNCKFQDVYGDCVLELPICCNKIYEGGSDEWELAE